MANLVKAITLGYQRQGSGATSISNEESDDNKAADGKFLATRTERLHHSFWWPALLIWWGIKNIA